MSGLIFDICNNVKVNKKKSNLFLKWITIFLPYIILAAFAVGGGWFTYTNKINAVEKKQVDLSNSVSGIKKELKDDYILLYDKIDNVNSRVDRLYDQKIIESRNN